MGKKRKERNDEKSYLPSAVRNAASITTFISCFRSSDKKL